MTFSTLSKDNVTRREEKKLIECYKFLLSAFKLCENKSLKKCENKDNCHVRVVVCAQVSNRKNSEAVKHAKLARSALGTHVKVNKRAFIGSTVLSAVAKTSAAFLPLEACQKPQPVSLSCPQPNHR